MQVFQGKDDLRGVESGVFFREAVPLLEEIEQFSAGTVLEDKAKGLFSLKGEVEVDEERTTLHFEEDVAFVADVGLLLLGLDHGLLEDLHGVVLGCVLLLDEDDLGVAALADD